jgi:hypothetical protein
MDDGLLLLWPLLMLEVAKTAVVTVLASALRKEAASTALPSEVPKRT